MTNTTASGDATQTASTSTISSVNNVGGVSLPTSQLVSVTIASATTIGTGPAAATANKQYRRPLHEVTCFKVRTLYKYVY